MNEKRPLDTVSAILSALGAVGGVIELFYRPFAVGPIALLFVLCALVMSNTYRRLTAAAAAAVGLGFIIGASIAVWGSNPLY